jgi:hypothetical protein
MKLLAKELKALGWFMEDKHLKPMLSNPPKMFFRDQSGKEVTYDMTGIVSLHKAWSADDQKERAREKRVADTRRVIKRAVY